MLRPFASLPEPFSVAMDGYGLVLLRLRTHTHFFSYNTRLNGARTQAIMFRMHESAVSGAINLAYSPE